MAEATSIRSARAGATSESGSESPVGIMKVWNSAYFSAIEQALETDLSPASADSPTIVAVTQLPSSAKKVNSTVTKVEVIVDPFCVV